MRKNTSEKLDVFVNNILRHQQMNWTNISVSPSRRPFWGSASFPEAPASRGLPMQSHDWALTGGVQQDRRGGKEGGSALFHRDPRPARYRPPESIPCWDIIPFNQGWLPDWSNKGQGGVRAAASREAGPTQTRSHGSESQRQRDRCHPCPPYTPLPQHTHPSTNITRLPSCLGCSLMLVPADQGLCAVCWSLPSSICLSSCGVPTLILVQRPLG